jgi:hypothetical protein
MLLPLELADAFSMARKTFFVGVKKSSRTLQKVIETPKTAKYDRSFNAEKTIMFKPVIRTIPIPITTITS